MSWRASAAASPPTTSCAPPAPSRTPATRAVAGSALLNEVVIPAVGQAERAFSVALSRINLDELVRKAEPLHERRRL